MSRGNTLRSPAQGVEVIGGEGREREERTDDVMDRIKGSEVEYLEFSTPYFIPMYRNYYNSGFSWQADTISRGL